MTVNETVLLAIIGVLGGAGGLFTLAKAVLDHRANYHETELEADERLVARLERRLDEAERRLDAAEAYIHKLMISLARAGVEIPPR